MLESSATCYRPAVGQDALKGTTLTLGAPYATGLPCSMTQTGAAVRLVYGQRQADTTVTLYFAQDPDSQPGDVIDVTDRAGKVYRCLVHGTSPNSGGRARLWQVDCEQLQEPPD
jgi:hypothetical protein